MMILRTYVHTERPAFAAYRKTLIALFAGVCTVVLLTVAQDFLRAHLQQSSFYLSESVLFSSFWWLFAPLLLVQYGLVKRRLPKRLHEYGLFITAPLLIHLLLFPFTVWLMSKLLFDHTFRFEQTLHYTLAEHLYLLVSLYSAPVLGYGYFFAYANPIEHLLETAPLTDTLIVADGTKKCRIAVVNITHFSAESPYVGVHTEGRNYLYTGSLKTIAAQLSSHQFVRIHKSTIVNINQVVSYSSRFNGDYDLRLKNGDRLRVSRRFASEFKHRFSASPPLTA